MHGCLTVHSYNLVLVLYFCFRFSGRKLPYHLQCYTVIVFCSSPTVIQFNQHAIHGPFYTSTQMPLPSLVSASELLCADVACVRVCRRQPWCSSCHTEFQAPGCPWLPAAALMLTIVGITALLQHVWLLLTVTMATGAPRDLSMPYTIQYTAAHYISVLRYVFGKLLAISAKACSLKGLL